jgi:hypothetical protein
MWSDDAAVCAFGKIDNSKRFMKQNESFKVEGAARLGRWQRN